MSEKEIAKVLGLNSKTFFQICYALMIFQTVSLFVSLLMSFLNIGIFNIFLLPAMKASILALIAVTIAWIAHHKTLSLFDVSHVKYIIVVTLIMNYGLPLITNSVIGLAPIWVFYLLSCFNGLLLFFLSWTGYKLYQDEQTLTISMIKAAFGLKA